MYFYVKSQVPFVHIFDEELPKIGNLSNIRESFVGSNYIFSIGIIAS